MSALSTPWQRALRAFDACFDGFVSGGIYTVLRVGLALLFLLRSADFTRAWLALDHHGWVHGFDFSWSIEQAPYLVSPLLPGLALGARATWVLLRARFALGLVLLSGIRLRWTAMLLTLLNYTLLFADRYRYFHHLHLLYLGIAWLALSPARPAHGVDVRPAWPLQLLRSLVLGIYLAAGSAKLCADWWSGDSLAILAHLHQVGGKVWSILARIASIGAIAKLVCLTELSLALLLGLRSTRRVGVVLALAFHCLLSCVMAVSTFGATMAVILLSFWPSRVRAADRRSSRASLQSPHI